MGKIYIITTAFESYIDNRRLTFTGRYLNELLSFNNFRTEDLNQIKKGILIWAGSEKKTSPGLILNNCLTSLGNNLLEIRFTDYEESPWRSYQLKEAVKKLFPDRKYLPLCLIVEEEKLKPVLQRSGTTDFVKMLFTKNDWLGIYENIKPYNNIEGRPEIWNDPEILSAVAFASAKLSECPSSLRDMFKSDTEKKNFLKKLAEYRKISLKLYKRLIELEPQNPSHYSNLGFIHYRCAMELSAPGGRRDGNFFDESINALKNLNQAIKIDPQRINDLYRKGNLMTDLMADRILYTPVSTLSFEERLEERNLKLKEGIETLEKIYEIYINLTHQQKQKRYFKYYIKSLYALSNAYINLTYIDTSDIRYLTEDFIEISPNTQSEKSRNNLFRAEQYAEKCIKEDSEKKDELIKTAEEHGIYDAVYKLYLYGKIKFYKYIISSENENKDTAKKFFMKALETKWSEANRNQTKLFIAEKLARIYIIENNPEMAISVLEPYGKKKHMDYYAAYTLSEAYILAGRYKEASETLNKSLMKPKSNKEIWKGHLLQAINLLLQNHLDKAESEIKKSLEEANKTGKKSIDYILCLSAFIRYKLNDRENALKILKQASEISGGRYEDRVKQWDIEKLNCGGHDNR